MRRMQDMTVKAQEGPQKERGAHCSLRRWRPLGASPVLSSLCSRAAFANCPGDLSKC